ncbi:hypothetical protein HDU83_004062 [Entophlyctis luteolus]|nr:hypothetical protein HDU83_004062 [Entophlyctis luteolus]
MHTKKMADVASVQAYNVEEPGHQVGAADQDQAAIHTANNEPEIGNRLSTDHSIMKILQGQLHDDSILNEITEQIKKLFVQEDSEGGIYCVHITHMPNNQPVMFSLNEDHDQDFQLIKFGQTQNFKTRFAQFGFKFRTIFKFQAYVDAEKTIKESIPANFKTVFFEQNTKVSTVQKDLAFIKKQSPGTTEWRIVSKAALERLEGLVGNKTINSSNCTYQLLSIFNDSLKFEDADVQFKVHNFVRKNMVKFEVYTYSDDKNRAESNTDNSENV